MGDHLERARRLRRQQSGDEGDRLVEELNELYELHGAARIRLRDISRGSVILTVESSAEQYLQVKSDFDSQRRPSELGGMQLRELRLLGWVSAELVGSGSAFARLSACSVSMKLRLELPEKDSTEPPRKKAKTRRELSSAHPTSAANAATVSTRKNANDSAVSASAHKPFSTPRWTASAWLDSLKVDHESSSISEACSIIAKALMGGDSGVSEVRAADLNPSKRAASSLIWHLDAGGRISGLAP